MSDEFEVSFNSPQCGWMSVGFKHGSTEFNTTTAHAPHESALAEILNTVTALLSSDSGFKKAMKWNRDPEEYDFEFSRNGETAAIKILEYPTEERESKECVFEYDGNPFEIAKAFAETFQQLYEEREIDEFEENWHQKFPLTEFENLKRAVLQYV